MQAAALKELPSELQRQHRVDLKNKLNNGYTLLFKVLLLVHRYVLGTLCMCVFT